ncbi:sodium/proton antiporter (CPA1 family) [Murinocardiopsis flavida]|uniref:Sodium/proton antiporter (CPA1 family) n=1 Tax=Murinocardiopsis flavida TaxID=645275 RepID=A0A2P8DRS2_9ACTN|nr:cation:proton antiporter [Murinocardiopsis flavida]PSK99916.1 sodium/proton antiporter (CPA1 family) [Murinocardiopsis flavida]
MHLTLILVSGVVSLVVVAAFAERLGLAAPLLLVVVGAGMGFVPGMPAVQVDPEWILAGILPPLLYATAITMPANDFRRNIRAISGLAVLLVVATTLISGLLLHTLVPGLDWPVAFAVGAVISPTDAVAATSVGRRLGLPSRLLTLLEGEGLVNDASALVLLRAAIAAMAASVSIWDITLEFVYSVVLASVIGAVLGQVNVRLRALLDDPVLNTAIALVVPFMAYLPAEELGASGVLAVVVTGVLTGHHGPRFLGAADRLAESTNWRTLAFLLEGTVFLTMGLALKPLIDQVEAEHLSLGDSLLIGLAAAVLVVVVRIAFTAPLVAMLHLGERRAAGARPRLHRLQEGLDNGAFDERLSDHRKQRVQQRLTRAAADVQFQVSQGLGWRSGAVLAWAGMRGAITVAAAQTLPDDTPYRPQLILIAFVVAATTLLVQGLTLPTVIAAAKVPGDDAARLRRDYERLLTEMSRSGQDALTSETRNAADEGRPVDDGVLERVRADSSIRDRTISAESADDLPEEETASADAREQYRSLRLRVIDAQRGTLWAARSDGTYDSAILERVQHALDREELSLQPLGGDLDRD